MQFEATPELQVLSAINEINTHHMGDITRSTLSLIREVN